MIISIIHNKGISVMEHKNNSPIAGHSNRPMTFEISLQWVKVRAGEAHILYGCCGIEPVQNVRKLLRMLRLDSLLRSIVEEVFQTLVAEAFDHAFKCNP